MVGLGRPVLDPAPGRRYVGRQPTTVTVTVLGPVGEGHAVFGEHDVKRVGEDPDRSFQKGRAFYLIEAAAELDVGGPKKISGQRSFINAKNFLSTNSSPVSPEPRSSMLI